MLRRFTLTEKRIPTDYILLTILDVRQITEKYIQEGQIACIQATSIKYTNKFIFIYNSNLIIIYEKRKRRGVGEQGRESVSEAERRRSGIMRKGIRRLMRIEEMEKEKEEKRGEKKEENSRRRKQEEKKLRRPQ